MRDSWDRARSDSRIRPRRSQAAREMTLTPAEHRQRYPHRWIQLDAGELKRAAILAKQRNVEGRGRKDRLGQAEDISHVKGVLGEFCVARYYGFQEPRHGLDFGKPDHGRDVGTRAMIGWSSPMPVKPYDDPRHWMVGVTIFPPDVGVVRGYYRTQLAQSRLDWKRDPGNRGPAFFVPLEELHDPDTLETAEVLK